ncbi:hypothetical protein CP967_11360 [Streptomyces nitrosporeus]|uniref:Protein SirB1 N-terminal domain-containing protein n=1 Tax=Streptomyces nitrosporeus TaxID=28894 RepID=A0A5J6F951_9ACTN|nr:transglutaminase-like domain-containing protein [Streptomyces nitrosporeus]QEU72513.1 hypothetical protein CP967_11360 [Streptomyces nitrosporeus]GGY77328.1 hypothetical protein GCM10010327_04280 [Streptomyces nitrosporeus]
MDARDPGRAERRRRFADEARAERPDIALLCLLLGAEAVPADPASPADPYGIDAAQAELDRLAGMVPYGARPARAWVPVFHELLGGRYGFGGLPADYRRLESSLLQEVLRRRRGLPILLSVVWTEVARRAGVPVYGLALPGHYVVGFGDPAEGVLADPFAGGAPLSGEDAALLVAGTTGVRPDMSALVPADPSKTVLRILANIRAWAAARPERTDVALWALELSLLLPSHPAGLRYERAELLVRRGEFLRGAAEMEEYAEIVGAVEPAAAEEIRHRARAARSRLN